MYGENFPNDEEQGMSFSHDVSQVPHTDDSLVIAARDVAFDWKGVPLEYIPGEPFATHFWNVMHLVLPEGERAMADVFAKAMPFLDDERLREEVIGFVGQENTHASSHEGFRHYLIENGVEVSPLVAKVEFLVNKVFGERSRLSGRAEQAWLFERLGIYAAAEHYTSVVGEWLLDAKSLDDANMDPTMKDLLRWHGAEEMEHRSVAFDAYMYVDGSWFRRSRTALIAALGLGTLWISVVRSLYDQDTTVRHRKAWPLAMRGAIRKGLVPSSGFFITELFKYMRPGFHPSQGGPIDKAVRYLATSPAALRAEA